VWCVLLRSQCCLIAHFDRLAEGSSTEAFTTKHNTPRPKTHGGIFCFDAPVYAHSRIGPCSATPQTGRGLPGEWRQRRRDRRDHDEFTLDAAAVVAEEAVERKEARRVKPWLSELDVPERVAGAGGGPAGVEEYVEEHQDTNTACVAGRYPGTGQKMDRAQDATFHVDQPRNQTR
jgi:hypothetical protein